MKQIPLALLTLVAGIGVTLISIWAALNHNLLPEAASIQAPLVDNFFSVMIGISTALFIIVEGAIIVFMVIFRKPKGDESDGEPIEGNVALEAFWTLIPAVIVFALGIYSVEIYQEMGGFDTHNHGAVATDVMTTEMAMNAEPGAASSRGPVYGIGGDTAADVVVNVTGMQYAWLFEYPGTDILAGELHIPVNQTVQLNLAAADVIHSFWVPQFRLKQDAIPGQATQLRFTATKEGEYPVICAELCGGYHGGMRTTVTVDSAEAYQDWLTENMVASQDHDHRLASLSRSTLEAHAQHLGITAETVAHTAALAMPSLQ